MRWYNFDYILLVMSIRNNIYFLWKIFASKIKKHYNGLMIKETTKLIIQEEIPEDGYTIFAKLLGQTLIDGDFKKISYYFNSSSELILYGSQTIKNKNSIIGYWKKWRKNFVLTRDVKIINVVYNNYYSNACLKTEHMLILFSISEGIVSNMLLSPISLNPIIGLRNNLMDFPIGFEEILPKLRPIWYFDKSYRTIIRENRIPCFQCGAKSENLEWYNFVTVEYPFTYEGHVSICPICKRVVEFYPKIRYNSEEARQDEDVPF